MKIVVKKDSNAYNSLDYSCFTLRSFYFLIRLIACFYFEKYRVFIRHVTFDKFKICIRIKLTLEKQTHFLGQFSVTAINHVEH